jgi:cell division inhibitor SepF
MMQHIYAVFTKYYQNELCKYQRGGVFMGAKLLNKMLNYVGLDSEENLNEEPTTQAAEENNYFKDTYKKSKLVSMPGTSQVRLVIIQAESFECTQDICDHLKAKKPVVVNLEIVDNDTARRIIDFLSGAVYAVDGNIQKVSNSIFLIAPHNIDIENEFKEEYKNKNMFPWIK